MTHAIVVFGCPAYADGSPRPPLRRRLEHCYGVAVAHPNAPVVVSGGSVFGPNESAAMRDWLVAAGLAAARLVCEPEARSTVENALLVSPILMRLGTRRVTLVTETFHAHRSRVLLARALEAYGAPVLEVSPAPDEVGAVARGFVSVAERLKLVKDLRRLEQALRREPDASAPS